MDLNDLRIAVTVVSMITFVGIALWSWSHRNQSRFDEAAQLPFVDEPTQRGARDE